MNSYLSPKVESHKSSISGIGLRATKTINKNEVVIDYTNGKGEYIDTVKADELYSKGCDYMIQISDEMFFAAVDKNDYEDVDAINHSCNPNCGIKGKLKIVSMRDIEPGEEITVDYAMMESTDYCFRCNCGAPNCRGIVTGNDWMLKELQDRYKGYFSDYLSTRIRHGV